MKGMKRRLLLISLILSVLAATLVFVYLQSLQKPKDTVSKVSILVASATIQERTLIDAKMIAKLEVPDSELVKDYIKDQKLVVGKYAKSTIEKNEGFLPSKLMDSEESTNEITVKIEKNHRAVSITATGESGISKLVKPGDHVDVYVFLAEKKDQQVVIRPDLARLLLANLKVLAIDRRLVRDANAIDAEKEATAAATNFLVTLSVPVGDVGKLILAEDIGSLKLALRSGEKEKASIPKTTTEQELYSLNSASGGIKTTPAVTPTPKPVGIKKPTPTPKPTITGNTTTTTDKNVIAFQYYTVQQGDTLMSLSRKYYQNDSDYQLIKNANQIGDDNQIEVGARIKIPLK